MSAEFVKAAGRGISLLFASGDSGAASIDHACPGDAFSPNWPAGSPWVTAVGGTRGASMPEVKKKEEKMVPRALIGVTMSRTVVVLHMHSLCPAGVLGLLERRLLQLLWAGGLAGRSRGRVSQRRQRLRPAPVLLL